MAVFIVAYNAEKTIHSVVDRIPPWVREKLAEIYVIDDSSKDRTFDVAREIPAVECPLNIYRTPYNQGYGGNQILGYRHAIEVGHDIVILLHGDGQYAPEEMPRILAPYADGADAVFGSRFLNKGGALKGGMPKYKFVGNRILTGIQNLLLGSRLSEMHSGYRSYRMDAMQRLPFHCNSKGFDFDADIIIQFVESGRQIVEVPIPTFYGDEICHVNGIQYAWRCVRACSVNLLMKAELFYDPKFDLSALKGEDPYTPKQSPTSLQAHVRRFAFPGSSEILDVGGGKYQGVAAPLQQSGHQVTVLHPEANDHGAPHQRQNLNENWKESLGDKVFDVTLALDIVERLDDPEGGLDQLFERTRPDGLCLLSTGNVAFLPIRLILLIGAFNYGRRGILDRTHKRLFTGGSFLRRIENAGFEVQSVHGFGPPIADLGKGSLFPRLLDKMAWALAQLWKGPFAYQLLVVCKRPLSHRELMRETFEEPYPS